MDRSYHVDQYLLLRKLFALIGVLRVFNPQGQMVLFCYQRNIKLKEDIRVYVDETKSHEVLNIQAKHILDFSEYYEVSDSQYSTKIGCLRRKGFRSLVQNEWEVIDEQGNSSGILKADSLTKALLHRMLMDTYLPQNYNLIIGNERVADYKQRFSPFCYELDIDLQMDYHHRMDHRLLIAAAVLLAIIEGQYHNQTG
jgi:hypothetical protein